MEYSMLLSSLMENLDLTLKNVSHAVSYDSSYISKWVNGRNLPGIGQIDEVNKNLSVFFAKLVSEKCVDQGLCFLNKDGNLPDDFVQEFSLETIIYNLLNQAYYKSLWAKGEGMLSHSEDQFIFGYDKVYLFLYEFFSQSLDGSENRMYMEAPNKFFLYTFYELKDLIFFFSSKMEINYLSNRTSHILDNLDYMDVLDVLKEFSIYDMNIYMDSEMYLKNYIYLEDRALILLHFDNEQVPCALSYTTKPEVLRHMESIVEKSFKNSKLIVRSSSSLSYENKLQSTNLYPGNKFNLFLSYPQGYFLNDDMAKKIISYNNMNEDQTKSLMNLRRLQDYTISNRDIEFTVVINLKVFLDNLMNKTLTLGPHMLKIKDEDFPAYIDGLIKSIEKYDHIKYHYINKPGSNDSSFRLCQTMVCTNEVYTIKKRNLSSEGLPFKYVYTLDPDLKNSLYKLENFIHKGGQ